MKKRTEAILTQCDAAKRLSRLFWDHSLTAGDFERHPAWIFERVLEYGDLEDVKILQEVMGKTRFLRIAAEATRVSPRTGNFWRHILEREGVQCTKRRSRDTAWNC